MATAPPSSIETSSSRAERRTIRRQVVRRVVLEPMLDPEAVAQRRRQQAGPGGRPDQRERRQVDRHDPRARALADGDRQAAVLHRRIERLLQRAWKPVDLVDEEHRPRLERRQERRDVALALERRPGGLDERHLELGGDDLRQRGLAESRRPGEQHMVERLAAARGRRDRDRQLVLERLLADEVLQPAGPQRAVELVLGQLLGDLDPGVHRRAVLQRLGDQLLGDVATGAVEQLVGLLGAVAEPDQAVAGEHPRIVAAADRDRGAPATKPRPSRAARR